MKKTLVVSPKVKPTLVVTKKVSPPMRRVSPKKIA